MKSIGEIISILNEDYVLARIDGSVSNGTQVQVYAEVPIETAKNKVGLDKVLIPKGTLTVISKQRDNIYLLAVQYREVKRTIHTHGNLGLQLSGLASLLGSNEEVSEKVPTGAMVDLTQSLNIKINLLIGVGDQIAKEVI